MDETEIKEEPLDLAPDLAPSDDSQYTFETDSEYEQPGMPGGDPYEPSHIQQDDSLRGEASLYEDESLVKQEDEDQPPLDPTGPEMFQAMLFGPRPVLDSLDLPEVAELDPGALNSSIEPSTTQQETSVIPYTLPEIPTKSRTQAEVAHRVPISRHGERPAQAYEYFFWGRNVRMFLWVQVLRKTPPNLIRKFYEGVLSPAQCTTRVAQRLRDYAKELAKPESRIVSGKEFDNRGNLRAFLLYYIPGNQSKDIPFWIAQTKEPEYIHVDRDTEIPEATVNAIIDDFMLQGISARRIAELFAVHGFYHQLFGAMGTRSTAVPRAVLKHLKGLFRKQQAGYESLLEGCIDGLIEHAPTPEIGYSLLNYAETHGLRSSGGRFLTAGVNWYKTWSMVWASLNPLQRQDLGHVNTLATATH